LEKCLLVVRKESAKTQQKFDKNHVINFTYWKIKSFHHYQAIYIKEWVQNHWDSEIVIVKSLYQRKKRIGSAITQLCNQKQVLIENGQSRYSNRAATLIDKSIRIKYSNRTLTEQTAQLESNLSHLVQPCTFKSQSGQFNYTIKAPSRQHSSYIKSSYPVIVQQLHA